MRLDIRQEAPNLIENLTEWMKFTLAYKELSNYDFSFHYLQFSLLFGQKNLH